MLIPVANGLLDPGTRVLEPHTPHFFNLSCLPFDFDPDATCPEWEQFLGSVFPADREALMLLQDWFGYLVSGRTDLHKALLILGRPRCGKGTCLKIAGELMGPEASVSPKITSLGDRFGLAPLAGKSLVTFGDVRLDRRNERLVESLLSLIGGDWITADRKGITPITFLPTARLMGASNLSPRFHDPTGAVATRWVILPISVSFLGREDLGLLDRLKRELPGILNWALDGLDHLNETGRLIEPASAAEERRKIAQLASPTDAFIEELCVRHPAASITAKELYFAYCGWCSASGEEAGSLASFSAAISAPGSGIRSGVRLVRGSSRPYGFKGVALVAPAPEVDGQANQTPLGGAKRWLRRPSRTCRRR